MWQSTFNSQPPAKNQNSHTDAFMENVHAIQINEQGLVDAEFFSPKMWHYPQGNIMIMQAPHFILFDEARPPWHITSLDGKAFNGVAKVELWHKVAGHQAPGKTNLETALYTEQITLYPSRKYAETSHLVLAQQPNKTVLSKGAQIDLTKHTIELLAKVRAEYVPIH